jgi:hypothetical protein
MNSSASYSPLLQPSADVFYVESTLPPGMTIGAYRRSRPRRPSRWARLKDLVGGAGGAAPAAA